MSGRGGRGYRRGIARKAGRGGAPIGASVSKKEVTDYFFYLGSAKQASDYETTSEFLINHIRKTYTYGNDIGTALETLTETDLDSHKPKLELYTKADLDDDDARAVANEQNKMEFKADYDLFRKRKTAYEDNRTKAYAFLWERCTKGMQAKLEARTDFTTVKGDPLKLLAAIKQHALSYQDHRYGMSIILDALRVFLNTKQKENESLHDFTKRFRTASDVLVSHLGGPLLMQKYTSELSTWPKAHTGTPSSAEIAERKSKIKLCQEEAYKHFTAFVFLTNTDQAKYGSLVTGLSTQQSLGNDQYPKSMIEAANVLSNHRFDNAGNGKGKDKSEKETRQQPSDETNEGNDTPLTLSFAQALQGRCYCCGEAGHIATNCPERNKPKSEWAINKAKGLDQAHAQQIAGSLAGTPDVLEDDDDTGSIGAATQATNTSSRSSRPGWCGAHVQFYQAGEMRDWILLDNQSTTSIFCNRHLVKDVRPTTEPMELMTNGGRLVTTERATVPDFGEVWFNPKAITNILSLHDVTKKYRVSYDSDGEPAFLVHVPGEPVRFQQSPAGLFYFKPSYSTANVSHVTTVEELKQLYTDRQVKRATRARDLLHALGNPSLSDLKAVLKMNAIANNPVTTSDLAIAEHIFGPDVGSLKGKLTHRPPLPVLDNYIELPIELTDAHHNVTLCMDTMKVNGLAFLTSVSRNLQYRTAEWVPNTLAQTYASRFRVICDLYRNGGYALTKVHCDNEFRAMFTRFPVEGVTPNYANPNDHVPEAERNIRVLKERIRATFHRLPFTSLPKLMLKILVMESAKKLNFFPAKGGVSPYYSPRALLHRVGLDYDKHCRFSFGDYVQARQDNHPTNSLKARTLDCIYLRFTANQQGGHELMDLHTGRLITRGHVVGVPLTEHVIKAVNAMAAAEGMPDGLKVTTKSGTILYDSAWLAGVHHDNDDPTNDDNDDPTNDNPANPDDADDPDDNDDPNGTPIVDDGGSTTDEHEGTHDDIDPNFLDDDAPNEYHTDSNDELPGVNGDGSENAGVNENDEAPASGDNDEEFDGDTMDASETTGVNDEGASSSRPRRATRPPSRYQDYQMMEIECGEQGARIIATVMEYLLHQHHIVRHHSHAQTYSLKKGLAKFGQRGYDGAFKEMQQLHDRTCFRPLHARDLTDTERARVIESLFFLTEKRDGRIKGRTCANGSVQRAWMGREDASSPTATTEGVLITAAIDAHEQRDVRVADIPNAFIQTAVPGAPAAKGHRIIMRIRGPLVDMLLKMNYSLYAPYVVQERNEKVLYVEVIKAIYGMLQSALLFYKKLRKDLESIGFKVNPYDPCIANRMVDGKQQTVTWHVDDLKISHKSAKVNDRLLSWLEKQYGDPKIGKIKGSKGLVHDYLGINLDYTKTGVVKVDMRSYVKDILNDHDEKEIKEGQASQPWTDGLFKIDESRRKLDSDKQDQFHTTVAKALFLTKRGRPDILPAVAFLCTRVKGATEQDWSKLIRLLRFLYKTKDDVLELSIDNLSIIKWYVDAAFAVHGDMRSHTGAMMTLGKGAIQAISTKQKLNTRSSTEAEIVGGDDTLAQVMWTKKFVEAQGYPITQNIMYRDNQSAMKIEENGRSSVGKRSRHLDIRFFFITDLINKKEVQIEYCPTDHLVGDYMTKPLVGSKFREFRAQVMGWKAPSYPTSK